jgi:predicted transposase/invertase (TIGR01784 family)
MTIIHFRHDKFTKKQMENTLVAKDFFKNNLPDSIKNRIDFNSLKIENDTFIEPSLQKTYCDLLFSINFDNIPGYLYLLMEQQTKQEEFMSLRLFKYMLNICSKYLNTNPEAKRLPVIYPIILSNSPAKYEVPRNLWELFVNPNLAKELWTNDHNVIDLSQIPDDKLKAQRWSGSMQLFLKYVNEHRKLKQIIKEQIMLLHKYDHNDELIESLLIYGLTTMEEIDKIEIFEFLNKEFGQIKGEEIMASVAQKWYNEGEEKGIERGEKKGEEKKAKTIAINLLKQGLDLKLISSATGLSILEIQKLKATL